MQVASPERKAMRSNPRDPVRSICDRCGSIVLNVDVAVRRVAVDVAEIRDDLEPRAGLFLAVDSAGATRPIRLPTHRRESGEALHLPHELSCRGEALAV